MPGISPSSTSVTVMVTSRMLMSRARCPPSVAVTVYVVAALGLVVQAQSLVISWHRAPGRCSKD